MKEKFCAFGIGDCGSSATIKNNIHNNYVNASNLKIFTNNVNKSVAQSIVKSSQSTSSAASSYAKAEIGTIVLGGSHNTDTIAVELLQQTNLSVKSIQETTQTVDMSSLMGNAIAANLKSVSSSNDYTNLIDKANASMKSGELAFTPQPVTANANNNIWNNQTNVVDRTFGQKISNYIKAQSQQISMKTCSSNISQDQILQIGSIVAEGEYNNETANVSLVQKISDKLLCKEFTDQSNKMITNVLNKLGIKTDDTSTGGTTTSAETSLEAKGEASGFDSIISALGEAISSVLGAYTKPLMYVAIACIVLC